jgi:hypothetical protein
LLEATSVSVKAQVFFSTIAWAATPV